MNDKPTITIDLWSYFDLYSYKLWWDYKFGSPHYTSEIKEDAVRYPDKIVMSDPLLAGRGE